MTAVTVSLVDFISINSPPVGFKGGACASP
jgi:hypothetical protein